jgi:hypothetical protein
MPISFDGANTLITLAAGDTEVDVSDVYSRWKEWVLLSDNAKYPPAFRETGGDPLGGGVFAGVNTFIRNDLGWRIKPPEQDIIINLVGNLYPEDPDSVWRAPTIGSYDTAINTNNAASALIVAGSGGGGGATADEVWDEAIAGHTDPDQFGGFLQRVLTKIQRELALGADNFTEDGSV